MAGVEKGTALLTLQLTLGYMGDKKPRTPILLPCEGILGPFSDGDTGQAKVPIRELGLSASLNPTHRLHSPVAEPVKLPWRFPYQEDSGRSQVRANNDEQALAYFQTRVLLEIGALSSVSQMDPSPGS